MGRIKSLQPAEMHSLFSYRRLVAEDGNGNLINNNNNNVNSPPNNLVVANNLLKVKLSQDYIAYCCGQCGHHQRLDVKVSLATSRSSDRSATGGRRKRTRERRVSHDSGNCYIRGTG